MKALMANEEIKLKWSSLSAEMTERAAETLFQELLTMFVTIRGYAYTNGCIEFFKQAQKKGL